MTEPPNINPAPEPEPNLQVLQQKIALLQKELTDLGEQYRLLADSLLDGVFIITDSRFDYLNQEAERIFDYPRGALMGKKYSKIIHLEDLDRVTQFISDLLHLRINHAHFEAKIVTGKGLVIFVEVDAVAVDYLDQPAVQGLVRDVTERKKLEEEKISKEKLAGVLEMAGATCHEVNQPLTAILGHAQLALESLSPEDPMYASLKIIEEQARRLGEITKKISRITSYKTKPYIPGHSNIIDIDQASKG
ncbi:MAG: PAS domain S-box protein [Deltaproteobacteria bacterium]|nr:PAS domain S-box protein [Deltaproteobacteria bacterium]